MNKDAAKIFSRVILSERTIRIKLLGDSITHGSGGTGFVQSGEPIVDGYARNPDVYVKASCVCGFPLICLYTPFWEYCEQKNITVNSLLADGLHPNDAGHDVIFKLLVKELGIARSVTIFQ